MSDWLQDYLDGRLSGTEREEAEARIRADPELAERVASWRRVRAALRDGEESLSPGFYARARARFEERRRPRRRLGVRLLSWEAAGLATAAILALAIFVPGVLERSLEPADTAKEQVGAAPVEMQAPREKRERPGVAEPQVAEEPPPVFAPVPQEVSSESGDDKATRGARADSSTTEKRKTAEAYADTSAPAVGRASARALAEPAADAEAGAVALTSGVLRELRVIEAAAEWNALLGGPNGADIGRLGGIAPDRRLVLLGADGGIDCASVRWSRDGARYAIRFSAGSSVAGCAFLVPRDGLPLVVGTAGGN